MLGSTGLDAEERRRKVAIELDSEIGDVPVRPDQVVLDIDRADDLVERRIGQVRRLADRSVVHLRPEHFEALPLGYPPSGEARALSVRAADIDMDARNLERI